VRALPTEDTATSSATQEGVVNDCVR